MFVLVQDGSITKTLNGNRGITINDIQYPQNIFTLWNNSQREAIGIYEVVFDNTNKKDEAYYINTDQSLNFAGGVVTASFGSPTAKPIDDVLFTADDEANGLGIEGEVNAEGLKTKHKRIIKQQAASKLVSTDWYITRKADAGTVVPSAVTTHRAAIRTRSNEMETAIDNAADVDALRALYEYVNTGTEENPIMERPLGEFPTLES
tara:strand:+ start:431 stop:1048 length:618 start_codon:yes stop_codon:yes gene_type:complete